MDNSFFFIAACSVVPLEYNKLVQLPSRFPPHLPKQFTRASHQTDEQIFTSLSKCICLEWFLTSQHKVEVAIKEPNPAMTRISPSSQSMQSCRRFRTPQQGHRGSPDPVCVSSRDLPHAQTITTARLPHWRQRNSDQIPWSLSHRISKHDSPLVSFDRPLLICFGQPNNPNESYYPPKRYFHTRNAYHRRLLLTILWRKKTLVHVTECQMDSRGLLHLPA